MQLAGKRNLVLAENGLHHRKAGHYRLLYVHPEPNVAFPKIPNP